jgi:hypothetical protein
LVFPLTDIEGVKRGTYFPGYYIMMPIDIRWFLDDQSIEYYKARVYSNNQVLISLPAWPYTPLYNREEIILSVAQNVTDAMDDARHSYEEKKDSRQWKHILLDFPSDHILSSKEIHDEAGDDEDLLLELLPVVYAHPQLGSAINTVHYVAWKVARAEVRAVKRGKIEHKNKSKGASLLESILNGGKVEGG